MSRRIRIVGDPLQQRIIHTARRVPQSNGVDDERDIMGRGIDPGILSCIVQCVNAGVFDRSRDDQYVDFHHRDFDARRGSTIAVCPG